MHMILLQNRNIKNKPVRFELFCLQLPQYLVDFADCILVCVHMYIHVCCQCVIRLVTLDLHSPTMILEEHDLGKILEEQKIQT